MIDLLRSVRRAKPETWFPAAFMVLIGSAALVGAQGIYVLLDGSARGVVTLLVPAFLVWWAWEDRHGRPHDELDPMVKMFGGSWLAGTVFGGAIWLLVQELTNWLS